MAQPPLAEPIPTEQPKKPEAAKALPAMTVADVQRLVDAALDTRLPRKKEQTKICSECNKTLQRGRFTKIEWLKAKPMCLQCKPVKERFQKHLKVSKVCILCEKDVPKDAFSATQWAKGSSSKYQTCVAKQELQSKNLTKECRTCHVSKSKVEFAEMQWGMPKHQGS